MNKKTMLVGEPMGLFISQTEGEFEDVSSYTLAIAGAELNVAIGMARLGHSVAYFTKVGNDPFGKRVVKTMAASGLDTGAVIFSEKYPTGFMFKSKVSSGDPSIFYFRKGSAASTLSPEDIEALAIDEYTALHMTGITPALSDSTREAVFALVDKARENGLFYSFDPNLRPQLWGSEAQMVECINKLAAMSDLFLPGIKEAKILCGKTEPEEIAKFYRDLGAKAVAIKLGAEGAYYSSDEGSGYVEGFKVEEVVDTVGAGDGFAAGVLSGLNDGLALGEAVRRGNAVGAIQVMSIGDNDGLPYRSELEAFMNGEADFRGR